MPLHRIKKVCEYQLSIIFQLKWGRKSKLRSKLAEILYDRRLFGMLVFLNGLEKRNFYFSVLIGNHHCTLCRNVVRFSLATPEFKT